jgi:hypothetical protein
MWRSPSQARCATCMAGRPRRHALLAEHTRLPMLADSEALLENAFHPGGVPGQGIHERRNGTDRHAGLADGARWVLTVVSELNLGSIGGASEPGSGRTCCAGPPAHSTPPASRRRRTQPAFEALDRDPAAEVRLHVSADRSAHRARTVGQHRQPHDRLASAAGSSAGHDPAPARSMTSAVQPEAAATTGRPRHVLEHLRRERVGQERAGRAASRRRSGLRRAAREARTREATGEADRCAAPGLGALLELGALRPSPTIRNS